jgi:chromosome segregation ATPase
MRTLVFLFATAAFAQTDTQPLQALLNEVHQLRVDLQTTAVTMQRVQIVLYRLQSQTSLVTRTSSQLDQARSQLGFTQTQKKGMTAQVQQMEESLRNTQDPMERKHLQEALPQMKNNLERVTAEEQRFQSMQIDAETQWRAEQAKLADLQDQLDRLDKVLDSFTRK